MRECRWRECCFRNLICVLHSLFDRRKNATRKDWLTSLTQQKMFFFPVAYRICQIAIRNINSSEVLACKIFTVVVTYIKFVHKNALVDFLLSSMTTMSRNKIESFDSVSFAKLFSKSIMLWLHSGNCDGTGNWKCKQKNVRNSVDWT